MVRSRDDRLTGCEGPWEGGGLCGPGLAATAKIGVQRERVGGGGGKRETWRERELETERQWEGGREREREGVGGERERERGFAGATSCALGACADISSSVSGTPPSPRSGHGLTSLGGKIYVHGGWGGSGMLRI